MLRHPSLHMKVHKHKYNICNVPRAIFNKLPNTKQLLSLKHYNANIYTPFRKGRIWAGRQANHGTRARSEVDKIIMHCLWLESPFIFHIHSFCLGLIHNLAIKSMNRITISQPKMTPSASSPTTESNSADDQPKMVTAQ